MAQIEKPSTTAIAEGSDELNSNCNVIKFTTTLYACSQRKQTSCPSVISLLAEACVKSGNLANFLPPNVGGKR